MSWCKIYSPIFLSDFQIYRCCISCELGIRFCKRRDAFIFCHFLLPPFCSF
uniref:Uncharacterized protein n=1 Tax=Rhizophora mucronata TaxID=61149 RepID=A0A2P2PG42_RHIMU